jgi:hypothetical protein
VVTTITPDIAARHGLSMNHQNNGIYKPGVAYGIERKLEINKLLQHNDDPRLEPKSL